MFSNFLNNAKAGLKNLENTINKSASGTNVDETTPAETPASARATETVPSANDSGSAESLEIVGASKREPLSEERRLKAEQAEETWAEYAQNVRDSLRVSIDREFKSIKQLNQQFSKEMTTDGLRKNVLPSIRPRSLILESWAAMPEYTESERVNFQAGLSLVVYLDNIHGHMSDNTKILCEKATYVDAKINPSIERVKERRDAIALFEKQRQALDSLDTDVTRLANAIESACALAGQLEIRLTAMQQIQNAKRIGERKQQMWRELEDFDKMQQRELILKEQQLAEARRRRDTQRRAEAEVQKRQIEALKAAEEAEALRREVERQKKDELQRKRRSQELDIERKELLLAEERRLAEARDKADKEFKEQFEKAKREASSSESESDVESVRIEPTKADDDQLEEFLSDAESKSAVGTENGGEGQEEEAEVEAEEEEDGDEVDVLQDDEEVVVDEEGDESNEQPNVPSDDPIDVTA